MSQHFGVFLIRKIMGKRHVSADSFAGLSSEVISLIMRNQGVNKLPKIYIDYLSVLGATQDVLFAGSDVCAGFLDIAKDELLEAMEEDEITYRLPKDAFVFFGHQGYHYLYFLTEDERDDPPVYSYVEGNEPYIAYEQLSYFYLEMIDLMT